jgi:glutamine cyclotransferase
VRTTVALGVSLAWLALTGALVAAPASSSPLALRVEVVRVLPHDARAFTQGLELDRGRLIESTGLYGQSTIREVDRETGRVLRSRRLPPRLFGEGATVVGDLVWQLTWREGIARVYARDGLRLLRTVPYPGEGWGACFDGRRLVTSDGSARLAFRDPVSFRVLRRVRVTVGGPEHVRAGLPAGAVRRLNELECVGRSVYANVYTTDTIVRIDPASGRVTAVIDASGLLTPEEAGEANVLNGIAHDPERGVFLLTGKLWPRLFEVRLVPR